MVKLQVLFYFDTVSYNIVQYLARDNQTRSGGCCLHGGSGATQQKKVSCIEVVCLFVKLQVLFYFDAASCNIVQYLTRDHQTRSGGLVDVASMEIRVQLSKNKKSIIH